MQKVAIFHFVAEWVRQKSKMFQFFKIKTDILLFFSDNLVGNSRAAVTLQPKEVTASTSSCIFVGTATTAGEGGNKEKMK